MNCRKCGIDQSIQTEDLKYTETSAFQEVISSRLCSSWEGVTTREDFEFKFRQKVPIIIWSRYGIMLLLKIVSQS